MKFVVPIRPISPRQAVDKKTGKLILDKSYVDINPNDKIALDVALDLQKVWSDTETVAVSVGGETSEQVLRETLAYGANRAILVQTSDDEWLGHIRMAVLLAAVFKRENFDIVLYGNHSPDELSGEIAGLVAGVLGIKAIPEVVSIDRVKDVLTVIAQDGRHLGRHHVNGPFILSLTGGLARADRHPNLWNIHKAFTTKLEKINPSELELKSAESFTEHVRIVSLNQTQEEESGKLRISADSPDMSRMVVREINRLLGTRG